MLDFTSAIYLGLHHPKEVLRPWSQFTTGMPAALAEPKESIAIAEKLAELIGSEDATLATSTLHLAWDLFGMLVHEPISLFMDAGVYPIIRWGAAHAAMRGVRVREFAHHDARALGSSLEDDSSGARPVVVTDGFCPDCGRLAPLPEYLRLARSRGGMLLADDTQALGVLGRRPSQACPFGHGGGGSFRWTDLHGPDVIVVASLAKAYGVPVAVLAGSGDFVRRFKAKSKTRVHCSPPALPILCAAEHALVLNRTRGDLLRERLRMLIRSFREELRAIGVLAYGGLFPVQSLAPAAGVNAETLHRRLSRHGIGTVLQSDKDGCGARVTLLLTARHSLSEMKRAAVMINLALGGQRTRTLKEIENKTQT